MSGETFNVMKNLTPEMSLLAYFTLSSIPPFIQGTFPQWCPLQWEVPISWYISPVPLSCLKNPSRVQKHAEVWHRISRHSHAVQCRAACSILQFSAPHRGSVHPAEGTCPEEREACVPCSKNAGSVYKVRHVSTAIVSKVSVKLALLLPRSEGYESNTHRWSATFHNETRLYCPEEAAFHNISIGACFFFYIFYFLCKLWAVLPLSLNQKSRTIKTCFITESWPSICVQWTSFSSLGCWHKHSQPKPERKPEQMQGSEYSQAWGALKLCG